MVIGGELRDAMRRRIACPIPWCAGTYLDHGGDGSAPDDWTHTSREPIPLPHGAELMRFRAGTDPDVWTVIHDGAIVAESTSRAEIARTLRAWADAVEQIPESEPRSEREGGVEPKA